MLSQIKCAQHPEQDIILVDIGQTTSKNRGLCSYCLEIIKPEKVCSIDKLPAKINEFSKSKLENTKLNCNEDKKKAQTILKLIITLKDRSEKMFNDLIEPLEQFISQMGKSVLEEQLYWQNLFQNVNRTKLDEVAEILSESNESQGNSFSDQIEKILSTQMANFKQYVTDQKDTLKQIQSTMFKKWIIESKTQCPQQCKALVTNGKQQLVIGAVGKNIFVWEQRQHELLQQSVIKGHSDNVTALAIYNSGELFVSGGDFKAKSLKLWKKTDNTWICIQKLKEHSSGITDIQLMKTEEQLFSASRDKTIKVWRMKNNMTKLECVQTLEDHTGEVYYVSISPNCQYLASTCLDKFFYFFNRETSGKELWKRMKKVGTTDVVSRVLITEDLNLIIQLINDPMLVIFEVNEILQSKPIKNQKLKLQPRQDNKIKIFAPMFQLGDQIYCVNEKVVYVSKKANSGNYFISQIITGDYHSGCVDVTGNRILLGNDDGATIDIFGLY